MKHTFDKLKEIGATLHVSAAGGGTTAIASVCHFPGRSSVILAGYFINDTNLFNEYVGVTEWTKYASMESATKLAAQSQKVGRYGKKHVGIGIATSLATYNERVGRANIANICAIGYDFQVKKSIEFTIRNYPDDEDRRKFQEDYIAIELKKLIVVIEKILTGTLSIENVDGFEVDIVKHSIFPQNIEEINIYPGSFNPIHDGHRYLKEHSEYLMGVKTYYELSLLNFEKAPIDFTLFRERVDLIGEDAILTYKRTFKEKYIFLKEKYPFLKNINFVCGIDTWNRISDEDKNFFLGEKTVKFIVFGRGGEWIFFSEQIIFSDIIVKDEVLKTYNNPISSKEIRNNPTRYGNV